MKRLLFVFLALTFAGCARAGDPTTTTAPLSGQSREDVISILLQLAENARKMEKFYAATNHEVAAYWRGTAEALTSAAKVVEQQPENREQGAGPPVLGFQPPKVPQKPN